MIILITGATHTGKTALAQKLMEQYHIPYLSQDHIKMGLIRSGYCPLSADSSDEALTSYLWPITKEMIKTAIENNQNLIIEGCYIPFDWQNDFEPDYLQNIKYLCLCFSIDYIENNYSDIMSYESCIESRIDSGYCTIELLKKENNRFIQGCKSNNLPYIEINDNYQQIIRDITI